MIYDIYIYIYEVEFGLSERVFFYPSKSMHHVGWANLHGPTLWSNRHCKPGPDFSCLVVVADHIRFDHCPNFQIGIFHLGTRCKAHRWYLPYA